MTTEYENTELKSIKVESFENELIETSFLNEIDTSYQELKTLLPSLPPTLRIAFGTNYDYGEDGVTGSSLAADKIHVGINPETEDRSNQLAKIRSLIFHEGYHVAHGFHLEAPHSSALESAIYEGCATIFERDYAGSSPKWGDYIKEDEATLHRWYEEMKTITAEQYFEPTGETWRKWAFYDATTDESWRVYKVGTWLVDTILKSRDVSIIELNAKTAEEILGYLN